ncbi:hypothetical protein AK812_SmicGene24204 [Symbiodinium microadriaticum]|uniref:Uncharacterized protein n=1 Tax=Symbiodinium microadriaticum TaxID=2951 RepID=A0A1Q9DFC8_SYMMI|nr:hypothetical protein AK812_SmicGene24204 [Symbiodinium microadriaticum]
MWTGSASKKGFSRGCSNRGLRSFSLRIQRVEDPPQPRLTPHPPRVQPGAMDPEATRVPCSRASLRSSQHRDAAGGPVLQAEAFKLPRSTAASLEGHVKEIRANSKLIAADLQNAHQEAAKKQLSLAKQRPANDSVNMTFLRIVESGGEEAAVLGQATVNMTFLRIVQSEGQGKKNQEDSQQLCQAQAKIHELQAVLLSSPDWTLHCDLVHLRLLFRVVACGFFHRVGSPSTSNTFRRLMFSNEKFLPARATVRPIEQADCLRCKSV